ncbi:hypothetical protein [Streptomyces sp. CB03238]|uniref:hypothetical protein n=1 Tax=Streptomyces sp. CB03238 TaxID=1907777 RepID=UPI000A11B2F8|nr:hypothetical protein [Streptomyces sp. CB03238]ORT61891.1 hypothetical protein BKD26_02435 [Streptomyces sp. CB03238]
MRTTARLLTGTALAVVSLGALASPGAYAAYAGDFGKLEVYPSTAGPGETVTVNTTACGKKGHGIGDAESLGAGEFELSPGTHKEVVVGQFRVPAHTKPGTYAISVACDNGKTASGDLVVKHGGGHSSGGTGGHDSGGHSSGGHDQGGHDQGGHVPSGHVKTGVGGSVGPDTTQIAAGVAVLAASAVGGVWLLRRRASGAQDS